MRRQQEFICVRSYSLELTRKNGDRVQVRNGGRGGREAGGWGVLKIYRRVLYIGLRGGVYIIVGIRETEKLYKVNFATLKAFCIVKTNLK